MYAKGCTVAFDSMMKETSHDHFDSGCDGICPECRACRFHRPFWKYQTCVFTQCPYSPVTLSTLRQRDQAKEC